MIVGHVEGRGDKVSAESGGDEEKAFSVFFDIYDNFKNITMKRYYKAVLSEDNIQYNNCMKHIVNDKRY